MKTTVRLSGLAAASITLTASALAQTTTGGSQQATPTLLIAFLAAALLLLVAGLLLAWSRSGRDPAGVVIPRFSPPEGVSATLAAYLADHSVTSRVFTTAIAELAARGFVSVVGGPQPRIDRAPRLPDERLPLELRALMEALLPQRRPQVILGRENANVVYLARSELDRNLTKKAAPYLRSNTLATKIVGPSASLVIAIAAGLAYGRLEAAFLAGLATLAYVFVAAYALHTAALNWERHRLVPGAARLRELTHAVANALFVFITPLLGGALLSSQAGTTVGALAATLALAAAWGTYLMPAFTPTGAEVWRHLQGLARYLSTTDAEELRRLGAPEDTPETLRRLYPYAIALGVESAFARRLNSYLDVHPQEVDAAILWNTGTESYQRMAGRHNYSLGVSNSLRNAYEQAGAYAPKLPGRGR